MIRSGTPWTATRTSGSSRWTTDAMYAPNPFTTVPSSTTSSLRCSDITAASVSSSYGLRKRQLTTLTSRPSAASDAAASMAGTTIVPTARMAISAPPGTRLTTSHVPNGTGWTSDTDGAGAGSTARGYRIANGPASYVRPVRSSASISAPSFGATTVMPGTASM